MKMVRSNNFLLRKGSNLCVLNCLLMKYMICLFTKTIYNLLKIVVSARVQENWLEELLHLFGIKQNKILF
ncbi:filamentous hemagglutinin family domain protein [Neisseria meningitidis NM3081]|nr:filamentous hemagglutinin family domain protein [Neisseria meningitidis NM3081]